MARAGRGARRGRHDALRRLVGRAPAGHRVGPHARPSLGDLQPAGAAARRDQHRGRPGGGRALPGVAAGGVPPSDDRGSHAAGVRSVRHVERTGARRLHVPRGPPRWQELRDVPGERAGSGVATALPFRAARSHAGRASADTSADRPRAPLHARSPDDVRRNMAFDWREYRSQTFDELVEESGEPRLAAQRLIEYLSSLSEPEIAERRLGSELAIKVMGITFTVYSDGRNVDRAWPFDVLPRVISRVEWERTEAGLKQRVTALNCFIQDIYTDQKIVKDRVFPKTLLAGSANYRQQCEGIRPRGGVWAHICGTDLVRDNDGTVYVLEDNLRVPSGVSYMIENLMFTKRVFPALFETTTILPVDDYPAQLYDTLAGLSPRPSGEPVIVLLTPGSYNSAYFEHCYLAQQMGIELVEGPDLFVGDDDCCYMRTIYGPKRVDVIYRRIDDLFLDPETFRPDSALGVRGLMRAWARGNVALANAPGAGVADDKVVYAFVPQMIKYYLSED